MSIIVDYIYSLWSLPETKSNKIPDSPQLISSDKTENKNISNDLSYLISPKELLSVKLKHVSDVIPSPARNMPHITKFQLHMLNKAQLQSILNVKLKPVHRITTPKCYPPRHPVLRELLESRPILY